MINFPTTSSVAVADVRPLLNRVVRIYKSAGVDGQIAISDQTAWLGWGIRDVMQWPPAVHPSAQAVRKDLLELVRRLTNAEFENRRGIAEQIKAAWESVGIPVKTMSGASGVGVVGPVVDGKVTCHINDGPGEFGNISYVNWTIDSVPVDASAVAINVPVKDTPTLVWAAVYDLHGNNYAVSWTIPPMNSTLLTLTPAVGDATHPTEIGYRDALFGTLVPNTVYDSAIRTFMANSSAPDSVVIDFTYVTGVPPEFTMWVDGHEVLMVLAGSGTDYSGTSVGAYNAIRNNTGVALPVYFRLADAVVRNPRVHTLDEIVP